MNGKVFWVMDGKYQVPMIAVIIPLPHPGHYTGTTFGLRNNEIDVQTMDRSEAIGRDLDLSEYFPRLTDDAPSIRGLVAILERIRKLGMLSPVWREPVLNRASLPMTDPDNSTRLCMQDDRAYMKIGSLWVPISGSVSRYVPISDHYQALNV